MRQCIGNGALVLNDAGVELNYGQFFFGWITGNGTNWPRPTYSPLNWYDRANGNGGYNSMIGEAGIEDNFFVGRHGSFWHDVPQSSPDGLAGYAEGPGYFTDLAQAYFCFLRATDNSLPKWNGKNYLGQGKYLNILNWYQNILNHDNSCPTYDNTNLQAGNLLGVLGIKEYPGNGKFVSSLAKSSKMDLRGDFILALGGGNIENTNYYFNEQSGNIILRNQTDSSTQTFHMLCEKDFAVDKKAGFLNNEDTHEDDDMGSWSLYVQDWSASNKKILGGNYEIGIDPPYGEYLNINGTNRYWMHNTIEINDGEPAETREYIEPTYLNKQDLVINQENSVQSYDLSFAYSNKSRTANYAPNGIKRNVNMVKGDNVIYYFFNDFVDVSGIALNFQNINININGNGNKTIDGSPFQTDSITYRKTGNLFIWSYPCKDGNNWSLTTHVAAQNNNVISKKYIEVAKTTNSWLTDGTNGMGISNNTHTKLTIQQPGVKKTIFQSFIFPQKCVDALPIVTETETSDRVSTTINFIIGRDTSIIVPFHKNNSPDPSKIVKDTVSNFHYARWTGNVADVVTNPFNLPNQSSTVLKLNAQKAFLKNNTYSKFYEGYCPPTFTNMRYASITNGSYLIYKDTLLYSTRLVDVTVAFASRHRYVCSIKPLQTVASTDSITIFLSDVARGVDMVALIDGSADTLPGRYDSIAKVFHLQLPEGLRNFSISQKEECEDCFFPPVNSPYIDTTFYVDDSGRHKLGHKLTIRPGNGAMLVSNSTKISMCPGAYIRNLDSIIIEGPCQTKGYQTKTCLGIDSLTAFSNNSSIIISEGSALVLDEGSRTILKNGAGIYVKRNGSLILKQNSFLQIGDSGTCNQGWGEIIAEAGAFIFIDPLAHIEFRKTIGDTTDRNLFVIPVSYGAAYAGIYSSMRVLLETDSVLPDTHYASNPIAICALDTINPIANREWGYSNYSKPFSTFEARNDTLCPGEPLYIKLNRILNDAVYEITVCRVDSILKRINNVWLWQDTCYRDTIVKDNPPPDPVCTEPRKTPDFCTFHFTTGSLHRLTVKAWNTCGVYDDTTALIFIADTPRFTFSLPATACEGIGTVKAMVTDISHQAVNFAWEITEIPDTANMKITLKNQSKGYSETFYGYLPDSFNFPTYYFKGARRYLISLSVINSCGTQTKYDTVNIPAGVSIQLERPTAYASPINGATAIKLHGYVSQSTSFSWSPTTWLDSPYILTPTSTPLDSIMYVLTSYSGSCVATDTAFIHYNRLANAGSNDTLCFDTTTVLLGNAYDMSLFLGYLYYYNATDFKNNWYYPYTSTNPAYFRYFTHFMMHDNFKNTMTMCGGGSDNVYNKFTKQVQKDLFFKQNWYKQYYQDFIQFNDMNMNSLSDFVTAVNNNRQLKDNLDSITYWGEVLPCMNDMFNAYNDYLMNHSTEVSVSWDKITDGDTTTLSAWNEFFVALETPVKSTVYRVSVITPGGAEIDEMSVFVDTALTPAFVTALQFDSTAYLINYTTPQNDMNAYEWNFGDGSAHSFEVNPIHTFRFDSSFKVCLTATNSCGSYTFCDTLWIDSAHWGGHLYLKDPLSNPITNSKDKSGSNLNPQIKQQLQNGEPPIFLSNYPNPFDNNTIIDYEIWQAYANAELRITNLLGQSVFNQKLVKPIDKIQIDGSTLHDGLYYCSIIVDGAVRQTKSMSVMH